MRKSSAPGSEAARDKWLVIKKRLILKNSFAPSSEVARDKWLLQTKVGFLTKVLPEAAKLPRTRGAVARKRTTAAAKGAERLFGGAGAEPPGEAGGVGGADPRLPPPRFEPKL